MKRVAQVMSFLALGLTLVAALLFFADQWPLEQAKLCMLVAALAWFATAPFWMEHKTDD